MTYEEKKEKVDDDCDNNDEEYYELRVKCEEFFFFCDAVCDEYIYIYIL